MNLIKKIVFKIISFVPTKITVFIIELLLWSKSENLNPKKALAFLFEVDKILYGLEGRNATRYDGGIHAKHRLMNYHKFFIDNIPIGSRVLDIGCGNGALAWDIVKNVKDVHLIGIDINSESINLARRNYQSSNLQFISGDATKDLPNEKFDVIVLSNVLEHIEKRIEFLTIIKEKYQPKLFLIRVPMFNRDWRVPLKKEIGVDYRLDETHFIEYTFEEFENEINQSGLKIKSKQIIWGEIWAVI